MSNAPGSIAEELHNHLHLLAMDQEVLHLHDIARGWLQQQTCTNMARRPLRTVPGQNG